MTLDTHLRQELVQLLRGGKAHAPVEEIVRRVRPQIRGMRPAGLGHSPWELLEHLRIAQWDILEFWRNPDHTSPEWPQGYWPVSPEPADDAAWDESLRGFLGDLEEAIRLAEHAALDLASTQPWTHGQSLLHELLLIADHNSHHLGQILTARRVLGDWPPSS